MIIEKYSIKLHTVEEEDALFIINLRTDLKRSRFISSTNSDVELQKEWIRNYKIREGKNIEFYFIATDENGEKFATYRVYNFEDDICEIGSWISKPKYNNAVNSIKVDIIMKEFVFETLQFPQLRFEVNKKNTSVIKYHKLFAPDIVNETQQNFYFVLQKENFENKRKQIFRNIK
ncbi:GNAT family N-acetyltransferase [Chryseobacterium sp. CFBP8996]|uniref:GNAT family N-acetyltransferase n=1 Tax=Chryseobacterium sp. CFBP8996 TaxID=3096529 RepID=UPI002A69949F|nr:GNAT family N-acetyltransferase [Chryseobacterium sp. CFBP8996]MDY0933038.1 GNAT family N-acetyltransferase [Chryseobacterium sp. CFBP8996]